MKKVIEITIAESGEKYEIISEREAIRFAESLRIAGVAHETTSRSISKEEFKAVLHRIAERKQDERK